MKKLFLAWQDVTGRLWYTVGRLTAEGGKYQFVYTKGALEAHEKGGFQPLQSFPDLYEVYNSDQLFPLFSNRLLSPSRPDYHSFVEWLNVGDNDVHPMVLLARSGGKRVTEMLEVFPSPEDNGTGEYQIYFFVHGLSHAAQASMDRALTLERGEQLLLMHDLQNPRDPEALLLRTAEKQPNDMFLMGYCPRYLLRDVHTLVREGRRLPTVTVERVNRPPAAIQFRLLCKMILKGPEEFHPFSDGVYQPLMPELPSIM